MLLSVACLTSLALVIKIVDGLLIPYSAPSPDELAPRSDAVPRALAPMERHPVQCHNESDFPGHADINYNMQWEAVHEFCDKRGSEILASTIHDPVLGKFPIVFKHRLRWKDWPHRINYDFFVEWGGFPLGKGGVNCYTLMRDNYLQCNNGGVGGSTQVGCLLFTFTGGKGGKCILTDEELKLRDEYDKKHNIFREEGSCNNIAQIIWAGKRSPGVSPDEARQDFESFRSVVAGTNQSQIYFSIARCGLRSVAQLSNLGRICHLIIHALLSTTI
ncbi:hypothetical protein LZ32DRAFT_620263 [Colletotrichum eremochloae]|nr:hypothetical protein LZ32DRAFT_620263 [Colletotrichum eremochloae]